MKPNITGIIKKRLDITIKDILEALDGNGDICNNGIYYGIKELSFTKQRGIVLDLIERCDR